MLYGHTMFIGGKSQKDIYLLQFITVASGGFKTDFKLNNIIATLCLQYGMSSISSVKNSPANTIKLSAANIPNEHGLSYPHRCIENKLTSLNFCYISSDIYGT